VDVVVVALAADVVAVGSVVDVLEEEEGQEEEVSVTVAVAVVAAVEA